MKNIYRFKSKIWLYDGDSPWHFVTIEKLLATEIIQDLIFKPKGFGSIPVEAKIGKTTWKTSIFPNKGGVYLLPLKKSIRIAEKLLVDYEYSFTIKTLI